MNRVHSIPCKQGIPVSPHGWGLYKFQLYGLINGYTDEGAAWELTGERLAEVDSLFYETFQPDMFHLSAGAPRIPSDEKRETALREVRQALRSGEFTRARIEEWIALRYQNADECTSSGIFDHVGILRRQYGETAFITVNEGNPICEILDPHGPLGFENGLMLLIEEPELMSYFIYRCYEAILPRMEALLHAGASGYIGSETYCGADLVDPALYRSLVFPAHQFFYTRLSQMGLSPICYFLGDIMPLLPDLRRIGIDALMVEESKKGFMLDVDEIYRVLEQSVTLFGNLDSVELLLHGKPDHIRRETEKQIRGKEKAFVMANGSPIAFDTPRENIIAMIDTARGRM